MKNENESNKAFVNLVIGIKGDDISLRDYCKRIDVPWSTWSAVRSGRSKPSISLIFKIANSINKKPRAKLRALVNLLEAAGYDDWAKMIRDGISAYTDGYFVVGV